MAGSHYPLVPYGSVWYLTKDHAIVGRVHELCGSQSCPLLFGPGEFDGMGSGDA